jgi:hypothetical protein
MDGRFVDHPAIFHKQETRCHPQHKFKVLFDQQDG